MDPLTSTQRAATTAITSIGLVLPASTMPVGLSHRITRSGDFFSLPFTRLSDAELIKTGDSVFTGRELHTSKELKMFKLLGSSVDVDGGVESAICMFGNIIFKTNGKEKVILIEKDFKSVDIIEEGELKRDKLQGVGLALTGAVLTGGLGLAAYFLRGKKNTDIVLAAETKDGIKLVFQCDNKLQSRITKNISVQQSLDAYKTYTEKDDSREVDPLIHKAISIAEKYTTIQAGDIDPHQCVVLRQPNVIGLVRSNGERLGKIDLRDFD